MGVGHCGGSGKVKSKGDKMARIMVLSFRFPYPLTDGARIRIYNLCRILAQKHAVDVVSLNEGDLLADSIQNVKSMLNALHVFSFPPICFKLNALKGLLSRDPLQAHYYYFPKVQRWINHHFLQYDIIFCFHIRMTRYLRNITTVRQVLDFIDATSINYREAQNLARGIWRCVLPVENRRLLSYEIRMLESFNKAFITSNYDKSYLEQHAGRKFENLVVIPNGVREDLFSRPPAKHEEDWIVFLGKMNYAPNVDAVSYFVTKVFSHIHAQLPNIRFLIVGTSPAKEVLKLARFPSVFVTGYVEDPYEYLEKAKIVVAPLRFSAGIQNKILEAMALRKAVVTTTKGARGIGGKDGEHFLVADEPEDMAGKILKLLGNQNLRKEIGENARKLVETTYRWDIIGQKLLAEIDQVLNQ